MNTKYGFLKNSLKTRRMKEPDIMVELHKVRERMSKMSEEEFDRGLIKARKEYKRLIAS